MNIIETNLSFNALSTRARTDIIVLHHEAGSGLTTEQIHKYHLSLGWAGIGYHFYVRKDGSVYRGRPEQTVGAHTYNQNSISIGICFEGNFENDIMGSAQIQAGVELLAYLKDKYGDLPIKKHCDYNATACPGKNFPFSDIVNGIVSSVSEDDTTAPCLSLNSSGEAVKTLQEKLNSVKTALGLSFETLAVDSIFGLKTFAAVKDFQEKVGLTVDGVVGPCTWAALEKDYTQNTTPETETPTIPETPVYNRVRGDINNDGKVSVADALLALQSSVQKITLTEAQKATADINSDGKVSAADAQAILKESVSK